MMLKSILCLTVIFSAADTADNRGDTASEIDKKVGQAVGAFQTHLRETYGTDRELYDARRVTGEYLLFEWLEAGQPVESRDAVVRWFKDAVKTPAADPLPSFPVFPTTSSKDNDSTVIIEIELPIELMVPGMPHSFDTVTRTLDDTREFTISTPE